MINYKGYTGTVRFDAEAEIFHGEVLGLRDVVTFQGTTVEEIKAAFQDSVDDYLEFEFLADDEVGRGDAGVWEEGWVTPSPGEDDTTWAWWFLNDSRRRNYGFTKCRIIRMNIHDISSNWRLVDHLRGLHVRLLFFRQGWVAGPLRASTTARRSLGRGGGTSGIGRS